MSFSSFFSADVLMSFITVANVTGILGAIFYIASMSMRTVIPLRIAGIASALFFLCSGIFSHSLPAIVLYAVLLPLNSIRLYQMIELIKKVRVVTSSDMSMDWLRPFMTRRSYRQGDIIFRKGDLANEMLLAVKGKYRVPALNVEIGPGNVFGEMGLVTSGYHRTQTVECIESGHVLTITYDEVRELYFENPEFGFYFLCLICNRLLQNLERTEEKLAVELQKH
jgi:Cyclic nucleotide-binding domain